jgi:hypothetical protein
MADGIKHLVAGQIAFPLSGWLPDESPETIAITTF